MIELIKRCERLCQDVLRCVKIFDFEINTLSSLLLTKRTCLKFHLLKVALVRVDELVTLGVTVWLGKAKGGGRGERLLSHRHGRGA